MAGNLQGYSNVSVAEFAQSLAESGLLDAADLLPDFASSAAVGGAAAAQRLVDDRKLTGYQAEAVLGRRFGELRVGNYEILDRIGAGGMGTVFKARHRRMKRLVALKVLSKAAAAGKMASRFQREVETIARLAHPNIVMAFDADEAEAGPFLVMEFVNGPDLATEVAQSGPLSVADAIDRVLQSARGLEYAHAQGLVHRDIKPGNILRDGDGVVKVADLGLARLNAPEGGSALASMTQAGTVFGTAEYMPPEQAIDAGKVDHRADIYSLGCTLYFLLAGRAPYPGESLMSVLLKHRDDPIPSLRAARTDVPAELEAVFRRMVAKAPGDRQQTMTEVVRELEQVQSRLGPAGEATGFWSPLPAPPTDQIDKTVEFDRFANGGKPHDAGGFEVSSVATSVPPPSAGPLAGLTVVLAESSRTQAGIIRRYLQQLGAAAVHVTGSGREALELARGERAGVIVSSMHLTDMTGVQLATTLLADSACAGVGFVLATSEADVHEPGAISDSPRAVVMPKPFDPERLARSIASVVGSPTGRK